MKSVKRTRALLLCTLFLCSAFLFAACGESESVQNTESSAQESNTAVVPYQVTVVDGFGTPYTEKIIVKFMQNGSQIAMATVDEMGTVQKELPKGEYSVEITTTESGVSCYYDAQKAVLTEDLTQLQLTMAYEASGEQISFTAASKATGVSKEYNVYSIGTGSTYVTLDQEDRTYVIFTPDKGGVYQFSVVDDAANIGYYGAPHFVQSDTLAEVTDNTFSVSVADSGISTDATGTTRLVIGLDVEEGAPGAIVNIQRIGDTEWSIMDEPWTKYEPKQEITAYTAPEGVAFRSFDLTASTDAYKLVLNGVDGYYHLNSVSGPVVYVQLANEIYGISMKAMVGEIIYVDGILMQSGVTSFRYMYDNGPEDFFKEDYTDVMRQFVTNRDQQTGVYPMTVDLYYALTMGIDFIGWCDPDNANYRFAELAGVNNEISWMFLCVYEDVAEDIPAETVSGEDVQENTEPTIPSTSDSTGSTGSNIGSTSGNTGSTSGNTGSTSGNTGSTSGNTGSTSGNTGSTSGNTGSTSDNTGSTSGNTGSTSGNTTDAENSTPVEDNKNDPIEIGGTLEFDAQVQANHIVYYNLYRVTDTTLEIRSNDAYVIYNRKTYSPVNGVVTVPSLYSSSTNVPVKIAIGNQGSADAVFSVKMSYPAGHKMNPYKLAIGANTTYSSAGNSQGVYYSFTATKDGILTVTLDSVSGDCQGNISITSKQVSGGTAAADLRENANGDGKSVSFSMKAGETVEVQIGVLPDEGFNYPEATIQTTVDFS